MEVNCSRATELILASGTAVTLVVSQQDRLQALGSFDGEAVIETLRERALACVVGGGSARVQRLRENVLAELACWEPDVITLGASGGSVVAVLRQSVLSKSLQRLHRRFFEGFEQEDHEICTTR